MLAPFFYVNFADFWMGDQLNSLVTAFTDLQYFVCFYATNPDLITGKGLPIFFSSASNFICTFSDPNHCVEKYMIIRPFMACLPAWFRFAQCLRRYRDTKEVFPHLANASKYATSFFVVIFTALYHVNSSGKMRDRRFQRVHTLNCRWNLHS